MKRESIYRARTPEARAAGRRWAMFVIAGLASVVVVNLLVWLLVQDLDIALATEDYYAESLAYDDRWMAMTNAREAGLELEVRDHEIRLTGATAAVTGITVGWYRPANPDYDFTVTGAIEGTLVRTTQDPTLPGRWDLSVQGWLQDRPIYLTKRVYRSR